MSTSTPPAYPFPSAAISQLDVSQTLPTYSRSTNAEWDVPAAERQHTFSLVKKNGQRWLSLDVTSRATSDTQAPTFYQGGHVVGTVRLELDKGELVDEITVALYGRLNIFSHSSSNFLHMSRTLYSAASTQASDRNSSPPTKRGRLSGRQEWTYAFRLPKGVSILSTIRVDGHAERQSYRLPPSFSDPQSDVHVQYSLMVRLHRAGFRAGSKLNVPIQYVPLARPCAPTILRQLAYQQNSPIVGPSNDPDGWKTLETVIVDGMLFRSIRVSARCTLSISRPLTYTRGAPIHLFVSIESTNEQFLDLLSPLSVHVALQQRVTFGDATHMARFSRRLSEQITMTCYERAVASWWRVSGDPWPPSTRTFAGELLIPGDLVPASHILHYGHEYELVLYPLTAVGFSPVTSPKHALLSEPVAIVTAFAQGPRPRSYIPPEYSV